MIGIINVKISKAELSGTDNFRQIVTDLFPNEETVTDRTDTQIERLVRDFEPIYTCIPRNNSRAFFIWLDTQEFEIYIETFTQSSLIDVSEGIVNPIMRRLKQLGLKNLKIKVQLQSITDTTTYMIGETTGTINYIWNEIKSNIIALGVSIILIIIAKFWLTTYYEESIAVFIGLIPLTLWQMISAWMEAKEHTIFWRCNG